VWDIWSTERVGKLIMLIIIGIDSLK